MKHGTQKRVENPRLLNTEMDTKLQLLQPTTTHVHMGHADEYGTELRGGDGTSQLYDNTIEDDHRPFPIESGHTP